MDYINKKTFKKYVNNIFNFERLHIDFFVWTVFI